ncbi:alpha/beta hydrolase [Mesorhizobium sp.]|uniref:alpha/beta hydrolase n=1 Tax=Mesorhizobium sp. TaxID=1871066 RepID=UPI00121F4196|nr:alpha/beta hydrolase [Mesorhizobium sp.]TIO05985.1 MAG: alpha/beta hydrolase [Mesorhizobium sp.]TIO31331.1 MAG: alpha/beta hydrolase [Mesorhizobium sp.]TIP12969.1 MAG: alpha/beta hydrolase [Mesorhizobium sp.]
MIYRRVEDWDDAYANGPNIPGGDRWPGLWAEQARAFRDKLSARGSMELDLSYGDRPRNRFDLFLPEGEPKGLVMFVHGGYWVRLDKSYWSYLAEGSLARGHAVALPSYTLCPDIRISGIVTEVAAAIEAAARMIGGPIRLAGHSAGGHLVSRMITTSAPLSQDVQRRIVSTVSISGLHDLRPLMNIAINADLKIDREEAMAESPALLEPMAGARLACWVGAGERAEFIRQNALLANIWTGLCAWTSVIEEPDRHHFNVIDGLADPDHALTRTLLTG